MPSSNFTTTSGKSDFDAVPVVLCFSTVLMFFVTWIVLLVSAHLSTKFNYKENQTGSYYNREKFKLDTLIHEVKEELAEEDEKTIFGCPKSDWKRKLEAQFKAERMAEVEAYRDDEQKRRAQRKEKQRQTLKANEKTDEAAFGAKYDDLIGKCFDELFYAIEEEYGKKTLFAVLKCWSKSDEKGESNPMMEDLVKKIEMGIESMEKDEINV